MKLPIYLVIILLNLGCSRQTESSKSTQATIAILTETRTTNNVTQKEVAVMIKDTIFDEVSGERFLLMK